MDNQTEKTSQQSKHQHNTFFIVVKSKNPSISSRLTLLEGNQVQFINDTSSNPKYDPREEKNTVWYIEPNQKFRTVRIQNLSSLLYLKYDKLKKKLICAPFSQENQQEYSWSIFLASRFKEFKVVNILNKNNIMNQKQDQIQYFDLLDFCQKKFDASSIKLGKQEPILTLYPVRHFRKHDKNKLETKSFKEQSSGMSQKSDQIPGFQGQVYLRSANNPQYFKHAYQYATSSYPPEKMSPSVICYPQNVQDIKAAIQYAKNKNYKITTRSGGHQYSGKSSGGEGTLVIDLGNTQYFTRIQVNEKNKDLIDVYPGVKLYELSNFLEGKEISIPHGQCQYVCIGGHGQTGGYGNFLRSFGLNMDYIQSFQIITADGTVHKLVRPGQNLEEFKTKEQQDNNQFFTGVLSGNAGSFGVITKYTYKTIRDKDHPKSWFYHNFRTLNMQVFRELLQQYAQWTKKIKDGKQDQIQGMDYVVTVQSFNKDIIAYNWTESSMLMELLDSGPNPSQKKQIKQNKIFDTLIQKFETKESILQHPIKSFQNTLEKFYNQVFHQYKGQSPLSQISSTTIKKWPGMTCDNKRQFNLPYKKRANVTVDSLNNLFIQRFCQLLEKVAKTTIGFVIQMQCGGGQYKKKGEQLRKKKLHTIPHRDMTFGFTFDFFYEQDQLQDAIKYQKQLQNIVNQTFSSVGNNQIQQKRFFWATFDDTDMKKQQVIKMYYDSIEQYRALQKLKSKYDESDLFSTELTIKPQGTPEHKTITKPNAASNSEANLPDSENPNQNQDKDPTPETKQ